MKNKKYVAIALLGVICVVLLILWRCHVLLNDEGGKQEGAKQEASNGCDYFNGEVTEITQNYVLMRPTEEWQWKETSTVKIPKIQSRTDDRGEAYATRMQTPLYNGDVSDLKVGDRIRVAFHAQTMEWEGDTARINVVFILYYQDAIVQ